MSHFDAIVIGQGLAGTAVAWQLLRRGRSVLVIDREPPATSSRVAAGLVTPITGKRLAKADDFDTLLPFATDFYRHVERITGARFFHSHPCVRLFAYEIELKQFAKSATEFAGLVTDPDPPLNPDWFHAPRGGFQMPTAARLDTVAFLDASRAHFIERGAYLAAAVNPSTDIAVSADGVSVPPLGVSAERLVFCQGFTGEANPFFPDLEFNAAKGEILTLRIPGLAETRVMNRGVWLAPVGGDVWRAGATYSWDPLDCEPTAAARDDILTRLRTWLKLPVEVIGHAAAVRPILADRRPTIRWSAASPRVGLFNGLGSKGALLAPWWASALANGAT